MGRLDSGWVPTSLSPHVRDFTAPGGAGEKAERGDPGGAGVLRASPPGLRAGLRLGTARLQQPGTPRLTLVGPALSAGGREGERGPGRGDGAVAGGGRGPELE